jgi:hypothetical protein
VRSRSLADRRVSNEHRGCSHGVDQRLELERPAARVVGPDVAGLASLVTLAETGEGNPWSPGLPATG